MKHQFESGKTYVFKIVTIWVIGTFYFHFMKCAGCSSSISCWRTIYSPSNCYNRACLDNINYQLMSNRISSLNYSLEIILHCFQLKMIATLTIAVRLGSSFCLFCRDILSIDIFSCAISFSSILWSSLWSDNTISITCICQRIASFTLSIPIPLSTITNVGPFCPFAHTRP